jgi:hypothetical protein
MSRLPLGCTQLPIQWVLEFFPRGKVAGAEVENDWSCASPPACLHGVDRETFSRKNAPQIIIDQWMVKIVVLWFVKCLVDLSISKMFP